MVDAPTPWPDRSPGVPGPDGPPSHGRHASGAGPDAAAPAGDGRPGGPPRHAAVGPDGGAAAGPAVPPGATRERLARTLLGARSLRLDATPRARLLGWLGPLAVTLLAGVARFWQLGRPDSLVFDETYYVKDGFSLWALGYEGQWGDDPNPRFEAGDTGALSSAGAYVVHPSVGKWLIGLGIRIGGVEHPWAWRLAAAVAGTLLVLLVARAGRRLLGSTALGTLAGLLVAVDGTAIALSRTSLLDGFLTLFVVAAFACLLVDRDRARLRLAERTAALLDAGRPLGLGPRLGARPWRVAAAVCLGLAVSTKWSGLYFVAVLGLLTVGWDAAARRRAGVRAWPWAALVRDAVPAFLTLVPTTAVLYVVSWTGWLVTSGGYLRQWAEQNPGQGVGWLPGPLRSLAHYHAEMWRFHNGLVTPHSYQAHPLGWPVQWRPTLFFYDQDVSALEPAAARALCGADRCAQAVTSLGNPLVWWLGTAAVLVAAVLVVVRRDGRAAAALSGVVAGWLPWFAYAHRTIFAFYSIAFLPWVVLTLVHVVGLLVDEGQDEGGDGGGDEGRGGAARPDEGRDGTPGSTATAVRRRRGRVVAVAAGTLLVVVVGVFFYPVWTGQVTTWTLWHLHVWLPGWT
nr:phospholipid carrier-dependent glycosyltransferase [Cellulomonas endophytica]